METTAILSVADFEASLAAARSIGRKGQSLPGLAAPIDGALWGRLDEAWRTLESVLRQGWRAGKDAARSAIDGAVTKIEEIISGAGELAKDLTEAVMERIRTLMAELIDRAIANVRTTLTVDGAPMRLGGLQVSQKVGLSGGLALSAVRVWELVTNGELEVVATYTLV
jgi:hypothetical protein